MSQGPCPLCSKNIKLDILAKHIRVCHLGVRQFECRFSGCYRKMSSVYNFVKHYISHFKTNLQFSDSDDQMKEVFCSDKLKVSDKQKNLFSTPNANLSADFISLEHELVNINNSIKELASLQSEFEKKSEENRDYLKEVSEAADILVAGLYANKFLVKTAVQP